MDHSQPIDELAHMESQRTNSIACGSCAAWAVSSRWEIVPLECKNADSSRLTSSYKKRDISIQLTINNSQSTTLLIGEFGFAGFVGFGNPHPLGRLRSPGYLSPVHGTNISAGVLAIRGELLG
jgi:hypothetical protein